MIELCTSCVSIFDKKLQIVAWDLQYLVNFSSSGTFISASEDKTGILDLIEEKIAKATMIPKTHGEVMFTNMFILNKMHYALFTKCQLWFCFHDLDTKDLVKNPYSNLSCTVLFPSKWSWLYLNKSKFYPLHVGTSPILV